MHFKTLARLMCVVLVICFAVCGLTACGEPKTVNVTITDGDAKTEVEIEVGKKVSDALEKAKITLEEGDECKPAVDTEITADTKEITVTRAEGIKVTLTADGKTTEVSTKATTVQELLDEQKITLGKDDEVSEKLDAELTEGMTVVVKRVEYKTETKKETIKFKTEEQYSSSMAEGTSEVTQKGVNGEKEITYKVKYVDGKEESREKVSEKVTKKAVTQITTIGTYSESDDSNDYDYDDDDDNSSGGNSSGDDGGVYEVSRQDMPDCDGSGHGYYIITYSDGSTGIEEY